MEKRFKTKDIYLAAAMLAVGQEMVGLERDGAICWFAFSNDSELSGIESDYWTGRLMVSARAYAGSLRNLKDRIFS